MGLHFHCQINIFQTQSATKLEAKESVFTRKAPKQQWFGCLHIIRLSILLKEWFKKPSHERSDLIAGD